MKEAAADVGRRLRECEGEREREMGLPSPPSVPRIRRKKEEKEEEEMRLSCRQTS